MQGCGALLWLISWLDIITNWAIGNYITFWVACYIDLETGFRVNMQAQAPEFLSVGRSMGQVWKNFYLLYIGIRNQGFDHAQTKIITS